MDAERLAKLKSSVRIGGKGTPRRKVKRVGHREADDSKVQAALQKLGVQTFTGVEQVNLFKDDGKVIHFGRPAVQQSTQYDLLGIHGHSTEKELNEILPQMIQSMGPESLEHLRRLTEQIQAQQAASGNPDATVPATGEVTEASGEKDIPELVEGQTFDKVE